MSELKSITSKKGKKEKRVTVEEIENGFLITKNSEWEDAKGKWHYESKKFYSETDPFEEAEKDLAEYF